jgi:ribulose-bisphosphate carboxylase large chain
MPDPSASVGESLADSRIVAVYHVTGSETEARIKPELICIDQTVEASEEIITADLRGRIVGRIQEFHFASAGRYNVTISYSGNLLSRDCSGLLSILFGTSSLRPGIRLMSF